MKDGHNVDGSEPTGEQNAARRLAAEAAASYAQSFDGYESAIVTGYILIFETQKIGEIPQVLWMTGNGVPPADDADATEGLATHRVRGLIQSAEATLHARAVAEQLRRMKDEDD